MSNPSKKGGMCCLGKVQVKTPLITSVRTWGAKEIFPSVTLYRLSAATSFSNGNLLI